MTGTPGPELWPDGADKVLTGGGVNEVVRRGDRVRRPRGPGSDRVAALLRHLEEVGFRGAPRHLGSDDAYDYLQFLPGRVEHYPLSAAGRSTTAVRTAAELLRRYHDATVGIADRMRGGWMLPDREPAEVVCHGDVAPYNCVFDGERVTGLIDFDTAHPGPRLRDIAYAVYRFAPLTAPTNDGGFGSPREQARRARLFCDAYGLEDRAGLVDAVVARLVDLVEFMREQARSGHPGFAAHVAAGHDRLYLGDVAHVREHADLIHRELAGRPRRGR